MGTDPRAERVSVQEITSPVSVLAPASSSSPRSTSPQLLALPIPFALPCHYISLLESSALVLGLRNIPSAPSNTVSSSFLSELSLPLLFNRLSPSTVPSRRSCTLSQARRLSNETRPTPNSASDPDSLLLHSSSPNPRTERDSRDPYSSVIVQFGGVPSMLESDEGQDVADVGCVGQRVLPEDQAEAGCLGKCRGLIRRRVAAMIV